MYQVYYETWGVETTPKKWFAGIPTEYAYVEKHYPQREEYKTLKRAQERAAYLRSIKDIDGRKYHNVKVIAVCKTSKSK